jgi:hypothetical protein
MNRLKLWWWAPFILWFMVLAILTSIPTVETPDLGFDAQDKLYHLLAFMIFAFLLMRAMVAGNPDRMSSSSRRTVFYGIAYAVFDEVHQLFIPGRYGDVMDGLADVVGILCGVMLFLAIYRYWFKSIQSWRIKGMRII